MKAMKEIKHQWLAWLIREELLPRYPDATGDQPGGWRVLARETAMYFERGEEVPYEHWRKAYEACLVVVGDGAAARAAAEAARAAAAAASDDARDAACYAAVADRANDPYSRMAQALVRCAELEPLPGLDASILAAIELGGSLDMRHWHTCDTTHCLAGFAVTLHPRGRALEEVFGSRLAGSAIYLVSTGAIPDFFASDEDALASIRKGAGR